MATYDIATYGSSLLKEQYDDMIVKWYCQDNYLYEKLKNTNYVTGGRLFHIPVELRPGRSVAADKEGGI